MVYRADLHTHTTASDGQYTPTELVNLAKARGIEVLAVTDHDNADGVDEAVRAGRRLGLRVVRGVEFAAREYHTFHILGYDFSPGHSGLNAMFERMKGNRDRRKYEINGYLREKGVLLPLEEVEALAGGVVGRPHFARVMVRRGYVDSTKEAFDRYLDTDEYHERIERGKPAARECVETVKAAGGKVSLAHPYQIGLDGERLDAQVRELADWGLDAIECYYPRHTEEMTRFYLALAKKYGLHVTGGSDFHGERVKPDIRLAALELELDWLLG